MISFWSNEVPLYKCVKPIVLYIVYKKTLSLMRELTDGSFGDIRCVFSFCRKCWQSLWVNLLAMVTVIIPFTSLLMMSNKHTGETKQLHTNKCATIQRVNILQTGCVQTRIHAKSYFNNKVIELSTTRPHSTPRTEVKEDFKETIYRQSNHSLI